MMKLDFVLGSGCEKLRWPLGESGELLQRVLFRGFTICACFWKTGTVWLLLGCLLMISPSVTSSQSWL